MDIIFYRKNLFLLRLLMLIKKLSFCHYNFVSPEIKIFNRNVLGNQNS